MTLMMMHVNDPVPNIKNLNPDVPNDLIAVINKALAKDPSDRYQTATQMADALRDALSRAETAAGAPLPPGETMIEESGPSMAEPAATMVEPPPSTSSEAAMGGTLVEADLPESTATGGAGIVVETPIEKPASPPPHSPPQQMPPPASSPRPKGKILGLSMPVVVGGGLIILACLIGGGIFMFSQFLGGGGGTTLALPTDTEVPVVVAATDTMEPTETATPEDTPTPMDTATPSSTPTATVPPGVPFARINSITIDDQNRYVVEYETFEFTETLPGMHVHFFFDTVAPENAGVPGSGPWILYGGPRPFTGYRVSDRPAAANQMCILVANANHSVQANSGNCMDLP